MYFFFCVDEPGRKSPELQESNMLSDQLLQR